MSTRHRAAPRARSVFGLALLATLALAGPLVSPAAAAPVGFQAAGGWYTETDEFFLHGGAVFALGTISLIPNIDWVFVSSGTTYSLNLDGTLSVLPLGVANVYAGAGLGLLTTNPENANSDTQTVFNLLLGAGFGAVPMKPFAQFKWIMADGNDPLAFSVGVRF
jgi:hypothetical protein